MSCPIVHLLSRSLFICSIVDSFVLLVRGTITIWWLLSTCLFEDCILFVYLSYLPHWSFSLFSKFWQKHTFKITNVPSYEKTCIIHIKWDFLFYIHDVYQTALNKCWKIHAAILYDCYNMNIWTLLWNLNVTS